MRENITVRLSNELSHSNLVSLGFYRNKESGDFDILCQDKYFKYASKKVILCVSKELDKIYALIKTKEYSQEEVCTSTTQGTLHFKLNSTTELISLVRMLSQ